MKCLLVAAFTICTCALAYAQENESPKAHTHSVPQTEVTPPEIPEPLFLISEGGITKEASKEELENLKITQIASVEMLLDAESVLEYGEKAKNGVMIISLKEEVDSYLR